MGDDGRSPGRKGCWLSSLPLVLSKLYFESSFRFTAKLSRNFRGFPCARCLSRPCGGQRLREWSPETAPWRITQSQVTSGLALAWDTLWVWVEVW